MTDYTLDYPLEGFVTKLNQNGNILLFSSYIGRINKQDCFLTLDTYGNVFVVGNTSFSEFPITPGAYYHFLGGINDIFITKINSEGSKALYSALFGGKRNEYVMGISSDDFGNAYICGYTESEDYPTTPGSLQETYFGSNPSSHHNGFFTKINTDGSALSYSTFLSGWKGPGISGSYERTQVKDIAVNSKGEAFITGCTEGQAFPVTPDAFQKTNRKQYRYDMFLTRFSQDGKSLVYSTYYGGSNSDTGEALAINTKGDVVIAGYTYSFDFPLTIDAVDDSLDFWTDFPIEPDAFVTKFQFDFGPSEVNFSPKPTSFRITGVYPNPFNPSTTIDFFLPNPGKVIVSLYSAAGQKVNEKEYTFNRNGRQKIYFEGHDQIGNKLSTGVYLIRLAWGKQSDEKKVLILK
jgi:hypothetical protein